jgi:hypothetical protein
MTCLLGAVTSFDVVLFAIAILASFFLLFGAFWFAWWVTRREASLSPYSGMPLRRATDLSCYSMEKVLRFLHNMNQYDNRIFEFRRSALDRETGRIFQNCVTWYDSIRVDWSFLNRRYPGHYVSWGSLTLAQKRAIREVHEPLDGFQTEMSCPHSSPRHIEPQYAFEKPGPLYVDVNTGILLGWKCGPDTALEVLIVQNPINIITISVPKDC